MNVVQETRIKCRFPAPRTDVNWLKVFFYIQVINYFRSNGTEEQKIFKLDHTRSYLSAILAGLILSMTMTCLLQYIEVVSATPRLEPGVLATSTKSGPEAVDTVSEKKKKY